jgi:hypothetical protein
MPLPRLEQVFQISGVPTYTFVEPTEYAKLLVSLRTPGRGVVVEGPSGIGKTSAVETALKKIGAAGLAAKFSARKPTDLPYIDGLPQIEKAGLVIIDDFHRLPDESKARLADYLKTLADESREDVKVVIVGINRAGERLISFAHDLVNRLDVIEFENNPDFKIADLVHKGEEALNIGINVAEEIVAASQGSFYIAQLLCHEVCLRSAVLERAEERLTTKVSFEAVRAGVWDRLRLRFYDPCKRFSQGTKMKPEGRAPYMNILHLLAEEADWTISLRDIVRRHPELRGSVGQVADKGFLEQMLNSTEGLRSLFHYESASRELTIEDPQLIFFLKHMPWAAFAKDVGFLAVRFDRRYDFALSFAGADRDIADAIFNALDEREVAVFYDKNEQHRILAEDVEEYLRPIYQSEASFVVCILGPEYPKRIWTKFESEAFRDRFKDGSVIPIWLASAPLGLFDESKRVGGMTIDRERPLAPQVVEIVGNLTKKLADHRTGR